MTVGGAGHTAPVDLLDDYTGHVEPGGPAARRDLQDVSITKVSVGPMDNNAYVLVDRGRVTSLATTHKHWDHVQSLEEAVRALSPTTYAGEADAPELPVTPDRTVGDGDTVRFGGAQVEIIHLDGHTPGSIALLYRDPAGSGHLFTGDSLFPGGPGKTAGPDEFGSLMDDLEAKVFGPLDDDTHVYPGHGDDTTLGTERPHLGEWRERGW